MSCDLNRISQFFPVSKSTDLLGDCQKSPKIVNLAISHVMKSITYKYKISSFRVFRQSLEVYGILKRQIL